MMYLFDTGLILDWVICVLATTTIFLYSTALVRTYLKATSHICKVITISIILISLYTILMEIDWLINAGYTLPGANNALWNVRDIFLFLLYIFIYFVMTCSRGVKR